MKIRYKILISAAIVLTAISMIYYFSRPAQSEDTGWNYPTHNGQYWQQTGAPPPYEGWHSPHLAYVYDGAWISQTAVTVYRHSWENFHISIPEFKNILGIEVQLAGAAHAGAPQVGDATISIRLWNDTLGDYVSKDIVFNANWPTVDDITVGGESDKWGATWTSDSFADETFRLVLSTEYVDPDVTYMIDQIRVAVHYGTPFAYITTAMIINEAKINNGLFYK